ncbi:hypothetical protein CTAYLR_000821 [Chrysophaeum taylorii]|uniref:DUF4269 domain-containing protein n=1 Tax=Chrysophaeum taylorii TaxID=2483200 RepID=A0AAD7XNR1_9STRA|nr:hypothetical protein CTAYLR_000821 [Chrysophaeum taylorii]
MGSKNVRFDWTSADVVSLMARGSERQQRALRAIRCARVFELLADYSPFLAGSVPLGVDLPERSDLDFLCAFQEGDAEGFAGALGTCFGHHPEFKCSLERYEGWETVCCGFRYLGEIFEFFAQARPVSEQDGYRHLVIEAGLLDLMGDAGRSRIREMKRGGLKTVPAIATAFGLPGDPYDALLEIYAVGSSSADTFVDLENVLREMWRAGLRNLNEMSAPRAEAR